MTGWKQVYRFTFLQTLKSRPIRIMTAVLCIAALLSMLVMQLVSSVAGKESEVRIETVWIVDESGLGEADYSTISLENEKYSKVSFLRSDKSAEEITEELKASDKGNILLHITEGNGVYNLHFIKSARSAVTDTEVNDLSVQFADSFNRNRIRLLGISKEQMDVVNAPVTTEVTVYSQDTGGAGPDAEGVQALSMPEYGILLAIITIIVMFFAFGGEGIASSIITEKSTRVIEYLMISIRPMAVIMGKVLAMLSVTLLQFLLLGISFFLSCFIKKAINPQENLLPEFLQGIPVKEILSNVTPVSIILIILIFIGGFLFFALLAGLAGATVSRIEELAEGIMIFNVTLIAGAYICLAVVIAGFSGSSGGILAYVAYLLPISTVFITPAYILLGRITVIWGAASLLILLISLAGLVLFTAKIYETLIMHQGNRLRIKDLVSISKQAKGGKP